MGEFGSYQSLFEVIFAASLGILVSAQQWLNGFFQSRVDALVADGADVERQSRLMTLVPKMLDNNNASLLHHGMYMTFWLIAKDLANPKARKAQEKKDWASSKEASAKNYERLTSLNHGEIAGALRTTKIAAANFVRRRMRTHCILSMGLSTLSVLLAGIHSGEPAGAWWILAPSVCVVLYPGVIAFFWILKSSNFDAHGMSELNRAIEVREARRRPD